MDPPVDQPGFNLYADQGPQLVGSMIALIVVSTATVLLRLLSRRVAYAGYWWDDVLVVVALLIALATPAINMYAVYHTGYGKHVYRLGDQAQHDVRETSRMLWTFQIFFVLATGTIKLCTLTFYRRIFASKSLRNVLLGMGVIVVCFTVGVLALTVFQCTPIHKFWDLDQPGYCINPLNNLLITGSINTSLDFFVVLLPVPLLWRLRTTVQQKCVLTCIFVLAGFVCVVSIIRLVVFSKVNMEDVTWDSTSVTLWSSVEPCAGIISACMPSLRPLLTRGLHRLNVPLPTFITARSKSIKPDSGASTRAWIIPESNEGECDVELATSKLTDDEKGSCVHNTLCTVPSAMRRANEKPGAIDGDTRFGMGEVGRPCGGIKVKTEIRWSVQEGYDYDCRIY